MGEVYLARDVTNPDFFVALKVIPPGIIDVPSARERFRNEIVAAYKISHPNIIKAYEYFDGEEIQAYAMEYVSGGDLLNRIKREPIRYADAARYLRQIASALETIHGAGIVHRDLKPENILITGDDQVKLADFGVARLRGSQTLTQAGAMVGTPKYIPPEYLETGESDHRGDIYALGVLGYEMLSGVSPFPADSRELLTSRRGSVKIPPLTAVAPHCPPALALIVERAMTPNLAQRYQSALELRRDIERFEAGELSGVSAAPSSIRAEPRSRALPPVVTPTHRLSFSRIVTGGAVVGMFAALIVVIARPVFFGAIPPPAQPERFDFSITPATQPKFEEGVDPRELGLELVRIGELESAYRALLKKHPIAGLPHTSAVLNAGPSMEGEPGTLSLVRIRERRLWLEQEVQRLSGKSP